MRAYERIDKHIDSLQEDIYEQPESEGHTKGIELALNRWVINNKDIGEVIDMGCGRGEAVDLLKKAGKFAVGVTIGPDFKWLRDHKPYLDIIGQDMHFTWFEDNATDLIFCRHALEHSYMPLILLKEFHRITRKYAIIVVPPHTIGVVGRNHYSILTQDMWERLFELAGFKIREYCSSLEPVIEHQWLLEKV